MESASTGDQVAGRFEAMTAPYYEPLVRRLGLIVGDVEEARDLAQATYLRAFEAWNRFDGSDARAWLYTIGIRLALNEQKRRRSWLRRRPSFGEATWAIRIDPDLWQALDRLDARPRAALVLNVLDGYTQAEIGRVLGVPAGTVSSWLSRAKAQLRETLREDR